ncbi:acyltransferase family protein [Diaminobutyricibacter sp. McL0618]|uniref:acyltransferase family protein n=1 Tax=Leifsonia sp. McL0618 TaxID=3415677 RepID=UPI003CE8596D
MTSATIASARSTALPETADGRSRAPQAGRFAGLDGLRALAVVAVIVYHLFPGLLPGGFIGVDVFFVISGFLITSLLVRERAGTGRVDLRRFWVRRGRRLIPALVAVVLVSATAAALIGGSVLTGIGRQLVGAATFSSNWLDIASDSSYFAKDVPELFRNLWSLAVEEQFYVVWPVLLLAIVLIRRCGARVAIVAAIAVGSAAEMAVLYTPGGDATRVYFGSDTHSFGLALGAVLALVISRIKPLDLDAGESAFQWFVRRLLPGIGVAALIALGIAAWWMHDDNAFTYRGGLALVSVLAAVVIWAAVSSRSRLGSSLDAAPLRFIGARSYGMYLWHWPAFVLVSAVIERQQSPGPAWQTGMIALAVTAVASLVSFRFVETPIRRSGLRGCARAVLRHARSSRPARAVAVAGLMVVALLAAGTVTAVVTAPQRTDAQAFIERGEHALAKPAPGASGDPTHPPAPRGAPDPHPVATGEQIMAIGDSVMLASAPSLQEAFPGIRIDAVVSRQMRAAPGILQAAKSAGTLRKVVLVGLGTNGSISQSTLDEMQQIAGPDHQFVFVTVQAPRGWTDGVNADLDAYAGAHQKTVALAEWKSAITPHLDLLAEDHIHPGSRGGKIYAAVVSDALHRLAERSPVKPFTVWGGSGPRPQ